MTALLTSQKTRGWALTLLFASLGAFLLHNPEAPKVTTYWFLTIFAISGFAFEIMPLFTTAVLLLMMYIVTGVASPDLAFVGWTTPIPWVILCGMLIGGLMERTKLSDRIALLTIYHIGSTPMKLYGAFIIAGYVVGAIIPDVITVVILFMTIASGMCAKMGLEKGSKAATTLIMAAFFGATVPATNFLPNNVGIVGLLMVKDMGVPIEWFSFFIDNLGYSLINALFCIGILHVFGSRELGQYIDQCRAHAHEEIEAMGAMNRDEKKTLFLTILAVIAFATEKFHGIPGYYAFCGVILLGFTPLFSLFKVEDVKEVQFPILFFIIACMAVGIVAGSLGIPAWMAGKVVPYLQNMESLAGTSIFAYGVGILANLALTPVAAASSLSIPMAEIAANLGLNTQPLLYSFFYGLDQFLFPYELAPALIMFATGYVRMKYLIQIMLPRMVLSGIAVVIVATTYWQWIGY
ncbi:SLC13 family permease [Desulfoluna spongiiphila]|uniref:Di-and tricarboxylate transporter n=1 Tax=Desulfoluna spongiiphila TaxID=419481 RepID=A0A1G5CUV0_9BACT|nr:SLC13 family permease [Desulfoluna spongiiphila]SCY06087.1 Di-and tricarboxylate transporter [Desulfoluna spongiiphila]VVS92419.1 solute carrier family 13 [Desulfoluna spongiiphila]